MTRHRLPFPGLPPPVRPTDQPKPQSEYRRLYRRPTKFCRSCGQEFPNTREHFALGLSGNISSTCVGCYDKPKVHLARGLEPCPICGQAEKLVQDNAVPHDPPWRLCRRCVMMHNMFRGLTTADAQNAFIEYVLWARKKMAPK